MSQKLHIKNMVCNRCIEAVSEEFEKIQVPVPTITLGEVELDAPLTSEQKSEIAKALVSRGFELVEDHASSLISQIKALIIETVHYRKEPLKVNFSTYLAEKLNHEYTYLSRLFSSVESITIEKHITRQKMERVKELLIYNELTLSQIAHQMNYSSVAHLSGQFKKETGQTPSQFRKQQGSGRKPIDQL